MRGFRHWKWHVDEVYVKINGETHYLWRAVDHEGEVLESYSPKNATNPRLWPSSRRHWWKTATCPSADESGRCCDFDK